MYRDIIRFIITIRNRNTNPYSIRMIFSFIASIGCPHIGYGFYRKIMSRYQRQPQRIILYPWRNFKVTNSIFIIFHTIHRRKQGFPFPWCRHTPPPWTGFHCRRPLIRPAIQRAIGRIVIFAERTFLCFVIQVLRHPHLLAKGNSLIHLTVTQVHQRIGDIIVYTSSIVFRFIFRTAGIIATSRKKA